ncbi:Gldg family protein [Agathobacter rectalis]|uniref:Gldg family protein n=1 Tax=Agathobacter rectalis TaxID=39491 RepID=UPI00156E3201|nr:Gldg family protein [Agathobacter rectalis]NSI31527.1 ABC transporter permease [Agathobacter rectalis]NSI86068.1 ABC transporter permease [Agathobacter rectalis]
MLAIFKREFKSYFQNVIGWLFVAALLAVYGLYFYVYNLKNGYPYISYDLNGIGFIMMIAVPILTMRSLSDEKKTKTDQLMLTSPVSVGRIVAGKYLAMAAVYTIDIALFALSPLVLSIYGKVALSEAYVALFGYWLYGLSCIAVGLFISSISESVIISAILTFAALFLSYMMQSITGLISSSGNLLTKVLNCFDLYTPFENFVSGCFSVTSAAYYVTVTLLLCFLTTQSIQKRRWAFSKKMIGTGAFSAGMIVIMCAICVVVNLVVTALPAKYTSIDCSATKLYSLTNDTKDRVSKLDEDITIYVLNSKKSKDAKIDETINRYKDLSSHIKVKYVDPAISPKFYQDYTDTTPTTNSLIIESKNRSKVIDYNDIYEYDSSSYYYGYQSQSSITGYDAEGQITSAIEYVTMDADELPVIYQITGHNETEIGSNFQSVVSKANANLKSLELFNEEKVPEDATAIIINSPTVDFNEEDAQKVIDYLNGGGKALIVGCYAYNDELANFNKILSAYNVSFKTGVIAENDSSKYYQNPLYLLPTVETTDYTSDATDGYVFLAGSCAISYPEDTDDVTYTKLLSTSDSAVLKKDWKNITTSKAEDADENGPFTTGLAVNDSSTGASIVVFGTPYVVDDSYDNAVSGNNADMFKDVITSMTGNVELASSVIPVKDYNLSNITINTLQAVITGLIIMIAVPILLIIIGIVVWAMRRKK